MTRWTAADLANANERMREWIATPLITRRQPRHGNQKCIWQGMKFDSLRELEHFKQFELERIAGKIRAVVRQVSLPLTGHRRRIRIDFMIIENTGHIRWVDSKGHPEREWLLKRDLIHQQFGIFIETI